ncbi:hypothetical protein [Streptomyces sp. KR80]|uniref:hypothetical protein n=1 Tax=Streptomyces sp. KR80 TaxID=3457426 RepID=UPI003FD64CDA
MNRRLSIVLAGGSTLAQATLLFAFHPLSLRVFGDDAGRLPEDIRVLGLSVNGFVVTDTDHLGGWLPQLVFLVLSAVLTYAVLRAAPGVRPRICTVLELIGAMLLAAGLAELLDRAMDTALRRADQTYIEWFIGDQLQQTQVASAQFALLTAWPLVITWTTVWRLRRWPPFQPLMGSTDTADGCGATAEPAPVLPTARERRDAVAAGLTVVVLLAVAGGPVLRHSNTQHLEQSSSLTFDPDLVSPYYPPDLIQEWSGVLYPALRMRPLRTEHVSGWLATLAICLVLLAVLAAALRAVAARAAGKHPLRVVMECWSATLLAATAAALVESTLLQGRGIAPRREDVKVAFDAASADAVRFGTVWGWATGAAFMGAVLVLTRRGRRRERRVDEGRPGHAE